MKHILSVADQCTGCTACMNICPKGAIRMVPDAEGFYYPDISFDLCINCSKCMTVCPVSKEFQEDPDNVRIRAYYGASTNKDVVKQSSSGGAFSVMAEYVLGQGGLVCGAAFNGSDMELIYKSTDDCDLDELRRSKYVASQPGEIFKKVQDELKKGRQVLFCGLPCHVHGLKSFLKKDEPNLITCDFICGGTASPLFFQKHLNCLEKKYGSKVRFVNFRAKLYGWKEHSIKIEFENGKIYGNYAFFDTFFKGYFEKPFQRDSCYQCRYRLAHTSDVIVADYWGGLSKRRDNDQGVSMVITNSEKGDRFFADVLNSIDHLFVEMPMEDSDYVFKSEKERYTKAFAAKKAFLSMYERYGFEKAARKTYFKGTMIKKIRKRISGILRGCH